MRHVLAFLILATFAVTASPPAPAAELVIRPLAEKKLTELPPGPLYWRVEQFNSEADARAVSGPTSLVTKAAGKIWMFTLGPRGGRSWRGARLADVGPLPELSASRYVLRVEEARGPRGSSKPVRTAEGVEAFFVLEGETGRMSKEGDARVGAGRWRVGAVADGETELASTGETDLHAFILSVLDATKAEP